MLAGLMRVPPCRGASRARRDTRARTRRVRQGCSGDLQEVGVVEPHGTGAGDALGQGVEHPGFGPLAGSPMTRDNDTYRASAEGLISPAGAERALVPAAELSEQAKEAIGRAIVASRSPNTRRSYQVAWRAWEAPAETVAEYLGSLPRRGPGGGSGRPAAAPNDRDLSAGMARQRQDLNARTRSGLCWARQPARRRAAAPRVRTCGGSMTAWEASETSSGTPSIRSSTASRPPSTT